MGRSIHWHLKFIYYFEIALIWKSFVQICWTGRSVLNSLTIKYGARQLLTMLQQFKPCECQYFQMNIVKRTSVGNKPITVSLSKLKLCRFETWIFEHFFYSCHGEIFSDKFSVWHRRKSISDEMTGFEIFYM